MAALAHPDATAVPSGVPVLEEDARGLVVARDFGAIDSLDAPVLEAPLERGTVASRLDAPRHAGVLEDTRVGLGNIRASGEEQRRSHDGSAAPPAPPGRRADEHHDAPQRRAPSLANLARDTRHHTPIEW